MKSLFTLIALLFASSVLAAPPILTDIPDTEVGPQPDNVESLAKQLYDPRLKDAESARYKVSEPFKCYLRGAPIKGGKITEYGWYFQVSINAKNSYGAYGGFETTQLIYKQTDDGKWTLHEFFRNMWFKEPWLKE